jgi:hypothetical protein
LAAAADVPKPALKSALRLDPEKGKKMAVALKRVLVLLGGKENAIARERKMAVARTSPLAVPPTRRKPSGSNLVSVPVNAMAQAKGGIRKMKRPRVAETASVSERKTAPAGNSILGFRLI